VSIAVHKPDRQLSELLLGFLDYYRSVIIRKIEGLPDAELRASRLPSGWAPLELGQAPGVHGAAVAAVGLSRRVPRSTLRRRSRTLAPDGAGNCTADGI
jgi:hypothetical protein